MSLRENIQDLFKPKEVREAERAAQRDASLSHEEMATVDYLEGRTTLGQYRELLSQTFPLTKLDLRKLASELNGSH